MVSSQQRGLRRPLRTDDMLRQTHKARHANEISKYNPKPIRLAQIKNLINPGDIGGTFGAYL